jgi:hypothetical protein
MPSPNSEADLIEAAYEDQVKFLYLTLFRGLEDGGSDPTPDVEQQCVQRFTLGLRLARRARELALSASSAAPARAPLAAATAAAPTDLPGRNTTKRRARPSTP